MRPGKKSTALVVRPRSGWRRCLIASVAVFVLTAAAVYLVAAVGSLKVAQKQGSQAIATVKQEVRQGRNNTLHTPVARAFSDLERIRTRVLLPEFIRLALLPCGIDALQTCENGGIGEPSLAIVQVQQGLSVHLEKDAIAGRDQIVFDLRLAQYPDAAKIARALAERFVEEYRAYWAASVRQANLDAAARVDRAFLAYYDALEDLQAFGNILAAQQQAAQRQGRSVGDAARLTTPGAAKHERQPITENPLRIELSDRLASLRQQESDMLGMKTTEHPDVQYLRSRIAEFEQQLSATPQFSTEFAAEDVVDRITLESGDKRPAPIGENEDRAKRTDNLAADTNQYKNLKTLNELDNAAELAEREYRQELEFNRRVIEAGGVAPLILIDVKPVAVAQAVSRSYRGLLGFMLFSGTAMALAAAVFLSGMAIEPVAATVADLELVLATPVIGFVQRNSRGFDAVARRRRQIIDRFARMVLGATMLAACVGGILWFFAGLRL